MYHMMKHLAEAHIDDLHRDARRLERQSVPVDSEHRERTPLRDPITIRRATVANVARLRRVAELDSSPVPAAPVLLAEVGGDVRAALSLADGAIVADPFHHTAAIVELLSASAAHDLPARCGRLRQRLRRVMIGRAREAGQREQMGAVLELRRHRVRAGA